MHIVDADIGPFVAADAAVAAVVWSLGAASLGYPMKIGPAAVAIVGC